MKAHHSLVALGILFSISLLITTGLKSDWSFVSREPQVGLFALVLLVLPIAPLALVAVSGWFLKRSKAALFVCMTGLIAAFAFMAYLFVDALYIHPDPQGGLVLLFAPFYTLLGLIPFGITALILFLRQKSHHNSGSTNRQG